MFISNAYVLVSADGVKNNSANEVVCAISTITVETCYYIQSYYVPVDYLHKSIFDLLSGFYFLANDTV